MTDIDTTTGLTRTGKAKELMGQAGQTLKAEVQSFASVAQERATTEAKKGVETAGRTLDAFANAVRKAGDELDQADQSPASRLVRQAADGLEGLSRGLAGKEPGELLETVRDFGRRNPIAFIGGAVLVGLALGRFVRASDHATETPRLADQSLGFEEDAYDGPAETPAMGGIAAPLVDNLGDLSSMNPEASTSLGVGDATSGIGDADSTGSTGGR